MSTVSATAVITLTQVTVTPLWWELLLPTIAPQESYLLALMLGTERSIRVVHNWQCLEEIQIFGFNIYSIIKFLRDHLHLTALYGRNCVLLQHHLWTWTLAKGLDLVPKNIKEGSTIVFPKVQGQQSHPFPLHEAEGDCQYITVRWCLEQCLGVGLMPWDLLSSRSQTTGQKKDTGIWQGRTSKGGICSLLDYSMLLKMEGSEADTLFRNKDYITG